MPLTRREEENIRLFSEISYPITWEAWPGMQPQWATAIEKARMANPAMLLGEYCSLKLTAFRAKLETQCELSPHCVDVLCSQLSVWCDAHGLHKTE